LTQRGVLKLGIPCAKETTFSTFEALISISLMGERRGSINLKIINLDIKLTCLLNCQIKPEMKIIISISSLILF
jgi:hypothetical protein